MAIRLRQQYQPTSGGTVGGTSGGLAVPVSNPGTNGSNARYYLGNLQRLPDGTYTDGTYRYDSNGLSLDRPDSVVAGLPPANESEGYDIWQLPSGGGGGAGTGATGGAAGTLASSPYYQQVLAATNSAATADAAARRSAIQQALISFGLVPEGFQDKYGDIDALTRDLAEKNTTSGLSTRARLLEARSDAIKRFSRGLSARGLRRSGAKGYGLRRRQLDFDRNYSDALGKLLGYTGGLYNQFASNEYQRQLGLANALAYASQSLGDYGGGGGSSGGATPYSANYSLANYVSPNSLTGPNDYSGGGSASSVGGSLSGLLGRFG